MTSRSISERRERSDQVLGNSGMNTFKLNGEFEVPKGYRLILTFEPIDASDPDEPLPPNPAPTLRAAA